MTAIYTVPFTYLVGWTAIGKFYYGVRFAKGCSPSDLWTKYFTSSKLVKQIRKIHGEPDIIQVRRTFESAEKALNWEVTVLRRLRAPTHESFLNQSIGTEKFNHGRPHTQETRKKLSEAIKGKPRVWAPGHLEKLSKSVVFKSQTHRQKLSEALKGKSKSDEHRAAMSAQRTGKKRGPYKPRTPEHLAAMAAARERKKINSQV